MKCLAMAFCLLLSAQGLAKEIKVAVGLSLTPYVIKSKGTGIELDIVTKALSSQGHTPKFIYVPFDQIAEAVKSGKADAGLTLQEAVGGGLHFSDNYVEYQNVAIALKESATNVSSIPDLSKYTIGSFKNAKLYLGPEFKSAADSAKKYDEFAMQVKQVRGLFTKDFQVFVGDQNIFKYYRKNAGRSVNSKQAIDVFKVFSPTPYKIGFKDKGVRDAFNKGLKSLKASGEYRKVVNKYTK